MRTAPPGSEKPFESKRLARFLEVDKEYYVAAMDDRKKEMAAEKKKRKTVKSKKNT